MKSNRLLLLCGALAVVTALGGCASVVETSKYWTARLTGADDPNNTGLLARAGRLQNEGTDAAALVAGVKPAARTGEPVSDAVPIPAAVVEPVVVPTAVSAPAPAASAAKSAKKALPTKKVAAKPVSPFKTIADTGR